MTTTQTVITECADLLESADAGASPIPPLTQRFPDLNLADAYAIQQVNMVRRLARGRTLVGHKIGLTSAPMQTLLGVDEPDFGYILDDMVLPTAPKPPAPGSVRRVSNRRSHSFSQSRCAVRGSTSNRSARQLEPSLSHSKSSTAGSPTGS
jgi:hypothetical protein